jgi:hypothetical protein
MSTTNAGSSTTGASGMNAMKTIPKSEWMEKLHRVRLNKLDLNKLVLNYLVIEGYKDAAEKFCQETGMTPMVDLAFMEARMSIRTAIQKGSIEEAIDMVNDLNPEILDMNPRLYFRLLQQQLIELIRQEKTNEALAFAQEELAPHAEQNPELLDDLEQTMTLLLFDTNAPPSVARLLDPIQRQRTASELNAAILASECQIQEPKLPNLFKLLSWAQGQLDERCYYPKLTNVISGTLDTAVPTIPEQAQNNSKAAI